MSVRRAWPRTREPIAAAAITRDVTPRASPTISRRRGTRRRPTMRTKQRLVRALIEEIVVDVDERPAKSSSSSIGAAGSTPSCACASQRRGSTRSGPPRTRIASSATMATRWSDAAHRGHAQPDGHSRPARATRGHAGPSSVSTQGRHPRIRVRREGRSLPHHAGRREEGSGRPLHVIRTLIRDGILPARQVMLDAPWQITATDLERAEVQEALRRRRTRHGRPCRNVGDTRTLTIPGT